MNLAESSPLEKLRQAQADLAAVMRLAALTDPGQPGPAWLAAGRQGARAATAAAQAEADAWAALARPPLTPPFTSARLSQRSWDGTDA